MTKKEDDFEFGSVRDRLMKARCRLLTIEPFYGTMCVNITWMPSESVKTIGVRMIRGGEIEAIYCVEFCEKFDVPTLMAIIKHEIEHIVRLHMVRMGSERKFKQWNVACVKPDEIILGDNMAIGTLEKGSSTIGEDGMLNTVLEPMRRQYDGDMVSIKGRYLLPFSVTPEHPIKVVPWHLKTTSGPKTTIKEFGDPGFVEASNIGAIGPRGGWALVVPKLKSTPTKSLDLKPYIKRPGDGSIKRTELVLDDDLAWMMGMYVAEGSLVSADFKSGCQWTLGTHETEYIDSLVRIVEEFGYSTTPQTRGSSTKISLSSPIIARAFCDWFGRGAHSKKLPDWLMFCDDHEFIGKFIAGYFHGDGSDDQTRSRNVAFTVSKTLALQIQLLLFKIGVPISLSRSSRPERTINGKILPEEIGYSIHCGSWQSQSILFERTLHRRRNFVHDAGDCYYVPITDVSREHYNGDVCNIATTDHTYLVSNAVVHNCDMVVNGRESHPRVEGLPKDAQFKGFYLPDKVDEKASAEEVYKWLIDNSIKINVSCPLCGNGKGKGKKDKKGKGNGQGKGKKDKGKGGGQEGGQDQGQDQDGQGQGQGSPGGQETDQGGGGSSGQPEQGQCPMCGGAGNHKNADISGSFIDDHSVWQDSTVSKDEARQIVKDMVDSAVRRAGNCPGHLIEVLKRLEKPIVNWKTKFRQAVGRKSGGHRRTFSRRSRRYNHFGVPGKSSHARTPLTICVDTSGSMSSKDLERVFTEIESMSQYFVITVIQFDHGVQKVEKYHRNDWKKIEIKGRGGTSFIELFKWMKDNKHVGKLNVVLSDGYAPWPEPQDFYVLWAVINKEQVCPWGDTIAVVKE